MNNQSPPPPPTPPTPQFQPASSPQTGMSTGAKVGIGCGIAALIAAVLVAIGAWFAFNKIKDFASNPGRTITESIVNNHPELENPEFDDEAKTVTVTYKKDGKRYTIDYNDAAKGKIEFKDSDGNITTLGSTDTSQIPDWVPQPESASNYIVLYSATIDGKSSGQYVASASGDLTQLNDNLKAKLGDNGFTTSSSHTTSGTDLGRWEITATKGSRQIKTTMVINNNKGQLTITWKE